MMATNEQWSLPRLTILGLPKSGLSGLMSALQPFSSMTLLSHIPGGQTMSVLMVSLQNSGFALNGLQFTTQIFVQH